MVLSKSVANPCKSGEAGREAALKRVAVAEGLGVGLRAAAGPLLPLSRPGGGGGEGEGGGDLTQIWYSRGNLKLNA